MTELKTLRQTILKWTKLVNHQHNKHWFISLLSFKGLSDRRMMHTVHLCALPFFSSHRRFTQPKKVQGNRRLRVTFRNCSFGYAIILAFQQCSQIWPQPNLLRVPVTCYHCCSSKRFVVSFFCSGILDFLWQILRPRNDCTLFCNGI